MRAADFHRLARDLRAIALQATENTGSNGVNAGELAVLEDIARNPRSTIANITRRTGLAQSLVSRITRAMGETGAFTIDADENDGRKVRIDLAPDTRAMILTRANNSVSAAISVFTPLLSDEQRRDFEHHLAAAEKLLRAASN